MNIIKYLAWTRVESRFLVCVWSSLSADWASNWYGWQSCLWSAGQGKRNFPCPRSRLRVWSRELGSAVPSRVSPLVLHTQAESGAYTRDSTPLSATVSIRTVIRHRAGPEFIGSRKCVTNWHRAGSSQGSSINGSFLFRYCNPMNRFMYVPLFPYPLLVQ